jgi:Phage tail lysozyme
MMKHILPINEWLQINEAYFTEGSSFAKLKDKGLEIMTKLIDRYNYSPLLAAALVGNMFRESKFDPTHNKTFKGLIQWSADRFAKLAKLGITGSSQFTVDAQLALINYELTQTAEKAAMIAANAAPSVEEAAYQIAAKYERCAQADRRNPDRLKSAREIYDLYMELQLPKATSFQEPVVSPDDGGDLPAPE